MPLYDGPTYTGTAAEQWALAGLDAATGRITAAELHALGARLLLEADADELAALEAELCSLEKENEVAAMPATAAAPVARKLRQPRGLGINELRAAAEATASAARSPAWSVAEFAALERLFNTVGPYGERLTWPQIFQQGQLEHVWAPQRTELEIRLKWSKEQHQQRLQRNAMNAAAQQTAQADGAQSPSTPQTAVAQSLAPVVSGTALMPAAAAPAQPS